MVADEGVRCLNSGSLATVKVWPLFLEGATNIDEVGILPRITSAAYQSCTMCYSYKKKVKIYVCHDANVRIIIEVIDDIYFFETDFFLKCKPSILNWLMTGHRTILILKKSVYDKVRFLHK